MICLPICIVSLTKDHFRYSDELLEMFKTPNRFQAQEYNTR